MGDFVALLALGIGAIYLLTGKSPFDFLNNGGAGSTVALTPQQQLAQQGAQVAQQVEQQYSSTEGPASGRAGVALVTGTAGTVATTIGGIAGVAGTTVALATGIGAAAALLTWGIVQKGWFRGGEEGVKVNPARDAFINTWIQAYYPGAGSERQFDAMVQAFADAGVNGTVAEQTIRALYEADTMAEFSDAATNFVNVLQRGY